MRTSTSTAQATETIALRARAAHAAAGLLTGHAISEDGQDDPALRVNVVRDAAGVFTRAEDRLWSEIVLAPPEQAVARPVQPLDPTSLAAALKPHGVRPEQAWATNPDTGAERNRRGYTLTALTQAITSECNQNKG